MPRLIQQQFCEEKAWEVRRVRMEEGVLTHPQAGGGGWRRRWKMGRDGVGWSGVASILFPGELGFFPVARFTLEA